MYDFQEIGVVRHGTQSRGRTTADNYCRHEAGLVLVPCEEHSIDSSPQGKQAQAASTLLECLASKPLDFECVQLHILITSGVARGGTGGTSPPPKPRKIFKGLRTAHASASNKPR